MHSATTQAHHITHGVGKKGKTRGLVNHLQIMRYKLGLVCSMHLCFHMTTFKAMQPRGKVCKYSDAVEEDGRPNNDDASTFDWFTSNILFISGGILPFHLCADSCHTKYMSKLNFLSWKIKNFKDITSYQCSFFLHTHTCKLKFQIK